MFIYEALLPWHICDRNECPLLHKGLYSVMSIPCHCGEWPLCPSNLLQVACRHRIVFFFMMLGNAPLIASIFVRTVL